MIYYARYALGVRKSYKKKCWRACAHVNQVLNHVDNPMAITSSWHQADVTHAFAKGIAKLTNSEQAKMSAWSAGAAIAPQPKLIM